MADVQVSYYSLTKIENRLDVLSNATVDLSNRMGSVESTVNTINNELAQLRQDFQVLMFRQQRDAALQRAATELVRVRQEIEDQFGNYKIVRDTMLGVLQATDAALVKQTTISRVSEELMLSTPKYWLAPCLVAVAAWIGNDRDLAERAIKEAMKRDEEKTAITMALICRRNKKTDTCYEWLGIYFENQDPRTFNEGDFAYIDAYVNGVFGPDEKHRCDGYIEKWMDEIRSSDAAYEEKQAEMWKNYCTKFSGNCDEMYPDLKAVSPDYEKIDNYISRIDAISPIQENFTKINDAFVDQETLKKEIDRNLIELISKYDEDEMELRNDEKYFLAVKEHAGDEEAARQMFNASVSENRNKVRNLIEQMYEVVNKTEGVTTSQKKTAISFIHSDINNGFDKFVKEHKESFPESIGLSLNGYNTRTTDGSDKERIVREYIAHNNKCMQEEVAKVSASKKPLIFLIAAIALGVVGLIMLFSVPFLGVVGLAAGGFFGFKSFKEKKNIAVNVANLTENYRKQGQQGSLQLHNAIEQWKEAQKKVEEFDDSDIKAVS